MIPLYSVLVPPVGFCEPELFDVVMWPLYVLPIAILIGCLIGVAVIVYLVCKFLERYR